MNVLVTGGTGALGRDLVVALRSAGYRTRVMSRRPGTGADWAQGDLATGKGLDAAVADMEAVVHAGSAAAQPWRLRATDVHGTRRMLEAANRAHVKHFVYVSIVGMEGIAYPYYRAKLAAEAIVAEDIVPWSTLRATQFHTLMEIFLGAFSRLPPGSFSRLTRATSRRGWSTWWPASPRAGCLITADPRCERSGAWPSHGSRPGS